MGLSAIEIFKFLPKSNCGECGLPTCLAFAMKLANKKAELKECPRVSEEAKEELAASSAPPMRLITMGEGDDAVEVGNETVLFRHEKKFFHQTAFGQILPDTLSDDELGAKIDEMDERESERVGLPLVIELVAVEAASGDPGRFAEAVSTVRSHTTRPMVLIADDPAMLEAGLAEAGPKPLLWGAKKDNVDAMAEVVKDVDASLVVKSDQYESLAALTGKLKEASSNNMVIDMGFGEMEPKDALEKLTVLRRFALKKNYRPLGYPTIMAVRGDGYEPALMGGLGVLKYANILLFDEISAWKMYPLFVLRQNIFTDPQKPIQVQPDIYPINGAEKDSPLLMTCNFSLTYFSVKGDVDRSKVSTNILVVDSEGLSVLTAYAADKLTPESMAEALEKAKEEGLITVDTVIIPGLIARARAKLQELTGFDVVVGPKDSSGLPKFLKQFRD